MARRSRNIKNSSRRTKTRTSRRAVKGRKAPYRYYRATVSVQYKKPIGRYNKNIIIRTRSRSSYYIRKRTISMIDRYIEAPKNYGKGKILGLSFDRVTSKSYGS